TINVPASASFGTVASGSTKAIPIAVGNSGTQGALSVSSGALTGGSWIVFTNSPPGTPSCLGLSSCTYSPALSISPGASKSVQVECAPPAGQGGVQTATLTFASDS